MELVVDASDQLAHEVDDSIGKHNCYHNLNALWVRGVTPKICAELDDFRALVKKETGEFYAAVRRGRPSVAAEPSETANYYDGDQALAMGLVDRNVKNLQEVIDAALAAHYVAAAAL